MRTCDSTRTAAKNEGPEGDSGLGKLLILSRLRGDASRQGELHAALVISLQSCLQIEVGKRDLLGDKSADVVDVTAHDGVILDLALMAVFVDQHNRWREMLFRSGRRRLIGRRMIDAVLVDGRRC